MAAMSAAVDMGALDTTTSTQPAGLVPQQSKNDGLDLDGLADAAGEVEQAGGPVTSGDGVVAEGTKSASRHDGDRDGACWGRSSSSSPDAPPLAPSVAPEAGDAPPAASKEWQTDAATETRVFGGPATLAPPAAATPESAAAPLGPPSVAANPATEHGPFRGPAPLQPGAVPSMHAQWQHVQYRAPGQLPTQSLAHAQFQVQLPAGQPAVSVAGLPPLPPGYAYALTPGFQLPASMMQPVGLTGQSVMLQMPVMSHHAAHMLAPSSSVAMQLHPLPAGLYEQQLLQQRVLQQQQGFIHSYPTSYGYAAAGGSSGFDDVAALRSGHVGGAQSARRSGAAITAGSSVSGGVGGGSSAGGHSTRVQRGSRKRSAEIATFSDECDATTGRSISTIGSDTGDVRAFKRPKPAPPRRKTRTVVIPPPLSSLHGVASAGAGASSSMLSLASASSGGAFTSLDGYPPSSAPLIKGVPVNYGRRGKPPHHAAAGQATPAAGSSGVHSSADASELNRVAYGDHGSARVWQPGMSRYLGVVQGIGKNSGLWYATAQRGVGKRFSSHFTCRERAEAYAVAKYIELGIDPETKVRPGWPGEAEAARLNALAGLR